MKKANQSTETKLILADTSGFAKILTAMDADVRKRATLQKDIETNTRRAREYEASIEAMKLDIVAYKNKAEKASKQVEGMPPSKFTEDDFVALLDKVAALPWVAQAELKKTTLYLTTRPGVLKTDFYRRMVIGGGHRAPEVLPTILTLPLPVYTLGINLANMGGTWARRPEYLSIKLENQSVYHDADSFAADEGGWVHEPRAHWGSNDRGYGIGDLCLGDYETVLINAGKEGLLPFLEALVIYLQSSGWAHAYLNKLAWAVQLGNPTYNKQLLRPFKRSETADSIVAKTRAELPTFLKANNLTMGKYEYGSDTSDSGDEPMDDDVCHNCDCLGPNDIDEDCACDCHGW